MAILDQKVLLGLKDLQEQMEPLVWQAQLVQQGHKDHQEMMEQMVQMGRQDHQGHQVQMVFQEQMVMWDLKDHLGQMDLQDQKDPLGLQALLVVCIDKKIDFLLGAIVDHC